MTHKTVSIGLAMIIGVMGTFAWTAPQPAESKKLTPQELEAARRGTDEEHAYAFTVGEEGASDLQALRTPLDKALRDTKAKVECLSWKFGTILTATAADAKSAKRLHETIAAYQTALAAFQTNPNPVVSTHEVEWTQMIQTQQIVYEFVKANAGFLIVAIGNNRGALQKLEQLRKQDAAEYAKP